MHNILRREGDYVIVYITRMSGDVMTSHDVIVQDEVL
jgi:hypothetical protein